jgi:hypothetical protein
MYKQAVWDQAAPMLAEMCKRAPRPIDFAKAFPEPPGMAAYRKAHPSRPDTPLHQTPDRILPDTQPAGADRPR